MPAIVTGTTGTSASVATTKAPRWNGRGPACASEFPRGRRRCVRRTWPRRLGLACPPRLPPPPSGARRACRCGAETGRRRPAREARPWRRTKEAADRRGEHRRVEIARVVCDENRVPLGKRGVRLDGERGRGKPQEDPRGVVDKGMTPVAVRHQHDQQPRRSGDQHERGPPIGGVGKLDDSSGQSVASENGRRSPRAARAATTRSAACRRAGLARRVLAPTSGGSCRSMSSAPCAAAPAGSHPAGSSRREADASLTLRLRASSAGLGQARLGHDDEPLGARARRRGWRRPPRSPCRRPR